MTREELIGRLEAVGLPFAPIQRPEDLFEDEHLLAAGGLVEVTLANGARAMLPALPLEIDGQKAGVRHDLPRPGEHNNAVLCEAESR
jgi:crotonobetainyl-CoA:carnitine CoA-transferase CaiB-like acyl-CoA transferase